MVEAVKLFVTSPKEAFAQTLRQGDYASPLIFALIVGWIGVALGQIWGLIFHSSMFSMMPGEFGDQFGMMMATSIGGFVMNVVLAPVIVVIALFIWSGLLHLCLMLVGGLARSTSGFEGTFRTVSYSSVAQLASLVPIVGVLIALIWSIVLVVLGFTDIHRTTQGKALAAAVIPIVLCCVCLVVAGLTVGAGLLAMFAGQGG